MHGFKLLLLMAWLCLTVPALAESIYTWTDKDGIKRFGNTPPPEGVKAYRTRSVPAESAKDDAGNTRRTSYDHMVKRTTDESQRLEQTRKKEAAEKAAVQQRQTQSRRQNKIDEQRKQLEKKIESIKNRGFSPTYSKGMQEAQIKEIRKQIEKLDDSSEASPTRK